jgi:hypothetical protein
LNRYLSTWPLTVRLGAITRRLFDYLTALRRIREIAAGSGAVVTTLDAGLVPPTVTN